MNNPTLPSTFSMRSNAVLLLLAATMALCSACSRKEDPGSQAATPQATLITVTEVLATKLEISEQAVGTMEGFIDPSVSAEVPGRLIKVIAHAGDTVKKGQLIAVLDATDFVLLQREAQAEIDRIQALLANQGRIVERNQLLVQKNFISQNALEDTTTQQHALREQLEGARARLASIEHGRSKTQVLSPIDGRVEKQIVGPGDFVKIGDPLFQLIGTSRLRAHLPFPEGVAARLHPGQTVRLSTPTVPDQVFTTTIKEIKPLIGSGNRAVDVIVDVVDQAGWQGGASVNGVVVLGEHPQAVVVPESSVVLRPAGEVVYVILNDIAHQRIVRSGQRQDGMVEITAGLSGGETIAVDGAGFLTDKAAVKIQQRNL